MKTSIYIFFLVVCGVFIAAPKFPKKYPPKEVEDQARHIVVKENKLDVIIHEIEYRVKLDSLKSK